MGIIEAIKKGFASASKNLALVAILFIFNAIWALGSIPLINPVSLTAPGAATPTPVSPQALGFSILFILISIFMQGGSLGLVRDWLKTGANRLNQFASYGLKYYLRLFLLGLIIILIVLLAAIIAVVLIAATAPLKNIAVTIIAATAAIATGLAALYAIILLLLAPYSLVCDDAGVMAAVKNSMAVVKKSFWKVVLLLILLILISFGVGFLIGLVIGLITAAMPLKAGQAVIGLANSAFNGYLGVAMMAAFMVFYLGLSKKNSETPGAAPSSPTI